MVRSRTKLIYGVGVNDFEYTIKVNGVHIPEYLQWRSMISRCYNKTYNDLHPTYKDVYVEEYLHSFTNFYNFIHTLKGYGQIDENEKPFQLDKDLLGVDKLYKRDNLCFIPQCINKFLTLRTLDRGECIIGVYKSSKNRFSSKLMIDCKVKNLGSFKTEMEAFQAYKEAKEQQAKVLAERWKEQIDERVYNALMNYKVNLTD